MLTQAPRGTRDVLPQDSYRWQYVEAMMRKAAAEAGFREVRTPVFEHTELFLRGVGDTTDIVQKEMYTFKDKGDRSITLKPEGTAGAVRALVEHSLYADALPCKMYYLNAPIFRYEAPQNGRLREHHQFGLECFGAKDASADAELILLAFRLLTRLGVKNLSVNINSIGCPACRPRYYEALKAYFEQYRGELCPTCLERLDRNPMRVLDCKSPVCHEIAKGAPKTIDFLCDSCKTDFDETLQLLSRMGVDYQIDSGIVRGLDYYTGPVFEFISNDIGAQGTVCGGGRYDGLVEQLGGKPTPALGFGSGLERLLLVMEKLGVNIPGAETIDVYVATTGKQAGDAAQKLILDLRRMGISAERDLCDRSLKAQMKYADKIGAKYVLMLGDNEIETGTAVLKEMATGEQREVRLDAIAEAL